MKAASFIYIRQNTAGQYAGFFAGDQSILVNGEDIEEKAAEWINSNAANFVVGEKDGKKFYKSPAKVELEYIELSRKELETGGVTVHGRIIDIQPVPNRLAKFAF